MYLLGCLKLPSFNPDSTLRIKLFCLQGIVRIKNKSFDICPCMASTANH